MENNASNRHYLAQEIKGGFCMQPDGTQKAFIYRASFNDFRDQKKRRKLDGMQAAESFETA